MEDIEAVVLETAGELSVIRTAGRDESALVDLEGARTGRAAPPS